MSAPGLLFSMSSLRVGLLAVLAFFGQVLGAVGKERLQPPHNVTLVSKDFKLFLTWQPAHDYPSGVSYTVKWRNPFVDWSTTHCVNITATTCDITCVYPKPSNRFQVQVEALETTGRTSERVMSELIDYAILVELAAPVLQVRKTERILVVNTTFTYPPCVKGFFQDLAYDLEFWEDRTKPKKFYDVMEEAVTINMTTFGSGKYCFRAQAFLPTRRKLSNFSEPVCVLLHEAEERWRLIVLLSLLLLVLPAGGAFVCFSWYRHAAAKFKMPQALDLSSHKGPKKFLEFGERELMKVDVIVCEREHVISDIRRRPTPRLNLPLTPSVCLVEEEEEDEDEDGDDDSGSPIPYTELRFQKEDMNCQGVGMGQKALDPPSESESFQSGGGCFPDDMVSKPFVSIELITAESTSELQDSKRTSLSGSSSAEESLVFSVGCPATRGERQQDSDGDTDFLVQLSTLTEGHDFSPPTETQFTAATDFPEGTWGNLEDWQIPLLRIQGNEDACGILLEEQTEEERGFENASNGCGRLMKEMLLLKASSIEGLESCTLGGKRILEENSVSGLKFHGYRPKHIHYISKT